MSNCNFGDVFGTGELCTRIPFTLTKTLLLTKPGFSFADGTAFADESQWLTEIAAGNILPIKNIFNVEPADVEDGEQAATTGEIIDTYRGMRGANYMIKTSLKQHEIITSYSDKNWNLFYADRNGLVYGTKNSDGTISGLSTGRFRVSKLPTATAEAAVMTSIKVQEADYTEGDLRYIYVQPTWSPNNLGAVEKVSVTFGTVTTNQFTATVKDVRDHRVSATGAQISSDISGLTADNFYIVNESGTLLVPTTDFTATEQAGNPGVYDINATVGGLVTGVGKVQATSTNLYSSPEAAIPTV